MTVTSIPADEAELDGATVTNYMECFGAPSEALFDELRGLRLLPVAAWLTAQASPGSADGALAGLQDQLERIGRITELHMRALVHRAERRDDSMRRASDAAERRIRKALAVISVSAPPIDPHGFHVYCLWGDSYTRPLYVGQSANYLNRLGTHVGEGPKRRQIKRITVIRCKNRRHMDETEARLIREYQPPWNKAGVGPRHPVHGEVPPADVDRHENELATALARSA